MHHKKGKWAHTSSASSFSRTYVIAKKDEEEESEGQPHDDQKHNGDGPDTADQYVYKQSRKSESAGRKPGNNTIANGTE